MGGEVAGERNGRRRTVLVAGSDESIRSLVILTLGSDETQVVEAPSAERAVAMTDEHQPSVAIVDVDLDGGGYEACERIKAAGTDVRTVLLVAKQEYDDHAGGGDAVDAFLTKPFTSLALLRKVDEVLGD